MNVSNKNVYHDRFNSSNIHVIKNHRKWAQDMTPSCGLHSWAVDHRRRSKSRCDQDRDTLTNQNSSDTNMQSCMSTESPVAVPIERSTIGRKGAKLAISYLF